MFVQKILPNLKSSETRGKIRKTPNDIWQQFIYWMKYPVDLRVRLKMPTNLDIHLTPGLQHKSSNVVQENFRLRGQLNLHG